MKNKHLKIFIALALTAGILVLATVIFSDSKEKIAVQNQNATKSSYKNITSQELFLMLKNKDFYFVNVHVPYDGEIDKTDAFIAYDQIRNNLRRFPKDRNAKIVVYCRSGMMSDVASQRLTELGFTNVTNLTGGMIDWEKRGYSIVRK